MIIELHRIDGGRFTTSEALKGCTDDARNVVAAMLKEGADLVEVHVDGALWRSFAARR